jgi:hypothetical protein
VARRCLEARLGQVLQSAAMALFEEGDREEEVVLGKNGGAS